MFDVIFCHGVEHAQRRYYCRAFDGAADVIAIATWTKPDARLLLDTTAGTIKVEFVGGGGWRGQSDVQAVGCRASEARARESLASGG